MKEHKLVITLKCGCQRTEKFIVPNVFARVMGYHWATFATRDKFLADASKHNCGKHNRNERHGR